MVKSGYVELVQEVSVIAAYYDLWGMCAELCTTFAYPLLTKCVILAKYWLWLPDDGFRVNRNMLEQFYLF